MAPLLRQLPIVGGAMLTLEFLSRLTVPLILIIVGYSVKIDPQGLGKALSVSLLRLGLMIPLALTMNLFVIRRYLQMDRLFEIALFTLLIMPPPFIIPLYARDDLDPSEKHYINNVLTVHTMLSVGIFLVYFILHPTLPG